jgi:hypothetical protein
MPGRTALEPIKIVGEQIPLLGSASASKMIEALWTNRLSVIAIRNSSP